MNWRFFEGLLNTANLALVAAGLFAIMGAAAVLGGFLARRPRGSPSGATESEGGQEGFVISAVLGLLALLLGFTFSIAVDRFDARRLLVLEEANAIGTTYLRAQLLPEPHRTRMSDLLVRYTDNRIQLAKAASGSSVQQRLLQTNDAMITDIWAATSAAFDGIKDLPFSGEFLVSVNAVIDLDTSRKMARAARVPTEVFAVLVIFLAATAGVLGYGLKGRKARGEAVLLLALLTLSLILIIDINRPVSGGVTESQLPMEDLRSSFAARPPEVFDKWRDPAPR
jgi:hypothetical protein